MNCRWIAYCALAAGCQAKVEPGPPAGDRSPGDVSSGGDPAGDPAVGDPASGDPGDAAGDPTVGPPRDRVGIYSLLNNYAELDGASSTLRFHFGQSNSRWGALRVPLAGDWNGDGQDTLATFDGGSLEFALVVDNDSDEWGTAVPVVQLSGVPVAPPPAVAEGLRQAPVAGDWDGDGVDGIGIYHAGSNTFYLKQTPTSGPVDIVLTLGSSDGYILGSWPLAGDWDGDGDDEVGVFDGTTAYLRRELTAGAPDLQYAAIGWQIAGDWDGDGTDTLATFEPLTNQFALNNTHTANVVSESMYLGHAESGYWIWMPCAGNWQQPAVRVASDGYDWPVESASAHDIDESALDLALIDAGSVASVLSVLVVRDGALVGERYFHGYERHIAGNIKSVSKSVLSALFGIAVDRGEIASVNDTVASYLPSYFAGLTDPAKSTITIENILNMRGGLTWSEAGGHVTGLILAADGVAYVLGEPMATTPGTTYEYSTGLTHVGSALLTEATGVSTLEYAAAHLLPGLGTSIPRWDKSPEGYYVGGAEMWMRPRDMARFGLLYLRGGTLDARAIVSQAWVDESADPTVPESNGRTYGTWWRERPWTHYTHADSYFAWGYGGQFIFLFPTWDLIVVVTSKWNVTAAEADVAYGAIFPFVDDRILSIVTP